MKVKKSLSALAITLALGASTTAFAAAADSFNDVPKDHWSYAALDELAKDGIIEGYEDGKFQGNRMMSRYEMATIVAKAMDKVKSGSLGDQALVEKLEKEYGSELDALDKKIEAVNARIDNVKITGFVRTQWDSDKTDGKGYNNDNKRFYLDLEGEMKISDNWKAKFQLEKNAHYTSAFTTDAQGNKHNHSGRDTNEIDKDHSGTISRIWVDGTIANNWYVNIGRKWSGIGYQNMLQGGETDGIQFWHPISKDLMVSGWCFAPTWDGADYTLYGANVFGKIANNLELNVAYGESNKEKWFGDKYGSVDLRTQLTPTVKLTGTYAWTGADEYNTDKAVRLDYKGTNLKNVGSFGAYTRYVNYGAVGDIGHDDEWGSLPSNMKGWILGAKYVPWENVEWETLYSKQKVNVNSTNDDRTLFRTQLDFHF
ncbi:S-layer homology domain-containing protein [Pelosinus fermentans]|uniref:S-layer domain-containing protein n=1 Tax=Pelosinus fermentans JBW45 TaxID=1192197 RepID=I9NVA8_9FIRM|nr:S-layer homology domain-containing protein [Pelosinus fermentans]AJQ28444.1 S-layer domain-containing protein [Pelosinus fermentans JBW45]